MKIQIEVPDKLQAMNICFISSCDEGFKMSNAIYDSDDVEKLKNEVTKDAKNKR